MSKVAIEPEGLHAFMAIDPGGTTGIAAAHIELGSTLKNTMQEGIVMKKAIEVPGLWLAQAKKIADIVNKFYYTAQVERGISAQKIHIGFENYTRRPHSADNNLEPVYVTAATIAYVNREDIEFFFQEPSTGKHVTNQRLKLYGVYEIGSEHKRDAWRHIVARVDKVLGTF